MASEGLDEPQSVTPSDQNREPGDRQDVGAALRVAYREAVDEAVPNDLLDLLGQLD